MADNRIHLDITADTSAFAAALTTYGKALVQAPQRAQRALVALGEVLRQPTLVVDDPAERWSNSPRELLTQTWDIVRHEFWMAQGRPDRSPGARWEYPPAPKGLMMEYQRRAEAMAQQTTMSYTDALDHLRRSIEAMNRHG